MKKYEKPTCLAEIIELNDVMEGSFGGRDTDGSVNWDQIDK